MRGVCANAPAADAAWSSWSQDVEFSFTLLDQANQAGANVRVTPYAIRVGANGQIFQSVKIVPFLAAFAQTSKQQLASQAALALNATAGLLQGDFAPAAAFAQATELNIGMQASPIPTVLTIRHAGGRRRFCSATSCCVVVR